MFIVKAALGAAFFFCAVIAAFGQGKSPVLGDGVAKHEGIDRIYKDFSKSYQTYDFKLVANLYTEDASYLSPDQEIMTGRGAIEENFKAFFMRMKSTGRSMMITFRIVKRTVGDGLGYDVGTFEIQYSEKGKKTNKGTGKFVVVTKLGKDGKWRFAVDGYSGLPPA